MLQDKIAIVTGGSKGIGASIVRELAKNGAKVIFTYLSSEQSAAKIVDDILAMKGFAKAVRCDGKISTEVEATVNAVVKEFGKIDILINNAGITKDNLLLRLTEEAWEDVMDANAKSVFNFTKSCIRPMMRSGGSIINMSSIVGIRGNAGQSNYAASKAAIIGFSKSIAQEYGSRNVRCNVIAPGFIETEMTEQLPENVKKDYISKIPLNRFGQTSEIAKVAVFLASEMSSYINGQVLSVCGGMNS
ncbi:MAG: 3-oxoacyl-[acyl-carrier-protein] reductase [Chitinophagales bacterium]|nr:3-oxoacyl-[acyl-carrier-protein] reductase [Chitinophagales bacterium]